MEVILDPDTARNGGYIKSGKIINRVYQKHKFNDYGNSVGIDEFRERSDNKIFRKEKKIKLKYLEQVSKSHHLNSDGFWSVYDYI